VEINVGALFFFRKESIKLTSKFRLTLLMLLMLVVLILSVTREFWSKRIGQSLVCTEQLSQSDLILVENVDQDYLLFERAAALHKAGFGARVLIPVQISHESERANAVSIGIAELIDSMSLLKPVSLKAGTDPDPVYVGIRKRRGSAKADLLQSSLRFSD